MALATLCSELVTTSGHRTPSSENSLDDAHKPLSSNWDFRAFIVDHGVRLGSNDEAKAVSETLKRIGTFPPSSFYTSSHASRYKKRRLANCMGYTAH